MVVTSDDYFHFINSESYFSRKLSTVLHENCVVILGYSLGDNNLKSILSDYKGFSRNHVIGSNIFFISKTGVNRYVKDYYSHCYGIRVLDNMDVHKFFAELNASLPDVEDIIKRSISNINKVVYKNNYFKSEYLKIEKSFFEIISSIAAIGLSIDNEKVVVALGKIIQEKITLTGETGAWEQYAHLAEWLIYLASILELRGTIIEDIYLDATLTSMNTMSKKRHFGSSWQAYKSWSKQWSSIIASNRLLIRNHIEKNSHHQDALSIVKRS